MISRQLSGRSDTAGYHPVNREFSPTEGLEPATALGAGPRWCRVAAVIPVVLLVLFTELVWLLGLSGPLRRALPLQKLHV